MKANTQSLLSPFPRIPRKSTLSGSPADRDNPARLRYRGSAEKPLGGYLLRILTFAPLSRRETMLATKAVGGLIVAEQSTLRTLGGKACDWKPRCENFTRELTRAGAEMSPVRFLTSHTPRIVARPGLHKSDLEEEYNCRWVMSSFRWILFYLESRDVSPEETRGPRKISSVTVASSLSEKRF